MPLDEYLLNHVLVDNNVLTNRGSFDLLDRLAEKFRFNLWVNEAIFREYCASTLFRAHREFFDMPEKVKQTKDRLVEFGNRNMRDSSLVEKYNYAPEHPDETESDRDTRTLVRLAGIGIVNNEDSDLENWNNKMVRLKKRKERSTVLNLSKDKPNLLPEADFNNGLANLFPANYKRVYKGFLDDFIADELAMQKQIFKEGSKEISEDLEILLSGQYKPVIIKYFVGSILDSKSLSYPLYAANKFLESMGENPIRVDECDLPSLQHNQAIKKEKASELQNIDDIFASFGGFLHDLIANLDIPMLESFNTGYIRNIVEEISKQKFYEVIEMFEANDPGSTGYIWVDSYKRYKGTPDEEDVDGYWRKKRG